MSTPLPPPTPPNPSGSSWKASDVLYVAGSGFGFFGGYEALIADHPEIAGFLAFAAPFLFWAASYSAGKGD